MLHSTTPGSNFCTTIHCKNRHRQSLLQHLHSVFHSLASQLLCRGHQDRQCIWFMACLVNRHSHIPESISGSWEEETYHTGRQLFLASLPVTTNPSSTGTGTHLAHCWLNCASLHVHIFCARKTLRLAIPMRMQPILKYACQFMTQQSQRPWTHIQIMHVYVRTFNTSLA